MMGSQTFELEVSSRFVWTISPCIFRMCHLLAAVTPCIPVGVIVPTISRVYGLTAVVKGSLAIFL